MSSLVYQVYEINSPDVVSEDFDGQSIIIDLSTGHYYSLGGIAGLVWSLLISGHTRESILDSLAAQRPQLAEDAAAFVAQLASFGLIRQAHASTPPAPIEAVWAAEAPKLEVFEDLAELIAADPVHDVDMEAGWPVLRPQS